MGRGLTRLAAALVGIAVIGSGCSSSGPPQPAGPSGGQLQPAAQATPVFYGIGQIRQQMLVEVNRIRSSNGLGSLALTAELDEAAQGHAADMAARGRLSHTGSDGSGADDRILRAGYRYREYAENIAQGQTSVAETVASWMDSSGHRANMLLPDVRDLGVGYAEGQPAGRVPGNYWVIVLGWR